MRDVRRDVRAVGRARVHAPSDGTRGSVCQRRRYLLIHCRDRQRRRNSGGRASSLALRFARSQRSPARGRKCNPVLRRGRARSRQQQQRQRQRRQWRLTTIAASTSTTSSRRHDPLLLQQMRRWYPHSIASTRPSRARASLHSVDVLRCEQHVRAFMANGATRSSPRATAIREVHRSPGRRHSTRGSSRCVV